MRFLEHLEHVRLGSICTKIGSGATPRGGESVYADEGVALIRSQNVYNGTFNTAGLVYLTEDHAEQLNGVTVQPRDVLLNITGDSVARCCQVLDDILPARVNQHVAIIRPDPQRLLPGYLCYYLVSPLMQKYLLSLAGSGGTRNALTKAMIEDFEVPCPELEKQNQIVSILSAYDDLIATNRRRIALLEQAARLLYREWFVQLRFPGYEAVRVVEGVPEGWGRKTLGKIAPLSYGKGLKEDNRNPGTIPVYGSSGVVGYHDKALVQGPGIIVGRKGNVGSVFWSAEDYHPIDTVYYIDTEHANLYLYCALLHTTFISTDVAVPGLNRDYAHSQLFLVPTEVVLRAFGEVVVPAHRQMRIFQQQNRQLAAARDLLLPRLMNGEIEV